MRSRRLSALALVLMLSLSGCFGLLGDEETTEDDNDTTPVVEYKLTYSEQQTHETADYYSTLLYSWSIDQTTDFAYDVTVTYQNAEEVDRSISSSALSLEVKVHEGSEATIYIEFSSDMQGFEVTNTEKMIAVSTRLTAPTLEAPVLIGPANIYLEEPTMHWYSGSVSFDYPTSCVVSISSTDGSSGTVYVAQDATWKYLLDMSEADDNVDLVTNVNCEKWGATYSDSIQTSVLIEGVGPDADGDGIFDDDDLCPNGIGEAEGWLSSTTTDQDSDGCRDMDEDLDDDNDGIQDASDNCPTSLGWISTPDADYDQDGCHDTDNDLDDDNDGIQDNDDSCPMGHLGWESTLYSDWDQDGCADQEEDDDDDNDLSLDVDDQCPKGLSDWLRDNTTDFDDDGCADASEDEDDDNDSVNDVNSTGHTLDLCPKTPAENRSNVDENGCADIEKDTDLDGVNDAYDLCPGTPSGNVVNSDGCADLDGDGVFSNVDQCPDTEERWTADNVGCAVYQQPVDWTEATSLDGPMQKVPQWSVATLDGTFNFKNNWDGYHTHMFIFKYSSSSSASTLWGASPGSYLRKMPDNVHVFWGSFDSSYHNDVVQMKSNVLAALSPQEEQEWQGRLHFIDIQGQTITGGLGDMISNFGNPFAMGIDRFQLSRETGSLYAWTSQSNDASHIAYESQQWNVEYPVKVRENDPNVHVVTLADFANHQGGWSSGHSSRWDVSFDLTRDLSSFDTLEVYHEHACDERKNRYQDSQGNYQGCHEWDYLANLYICDVDNSSKCNQEIMRWITTYGREGMWLTDISPYLFMLENDFHHYFRYAGANGGDMTIKFLFSDWGSGEQGREGVYAFSGGQFDGTYNDESKYNRQLNFTVPSWAQSVKIVATITGHGFNKDNANCAEFCDHEHHYFMNSQTTYEWHPIVHDSEGCEKEVGNGVVANQFGSWPFGRAGWCAGQDVKQWTYDISSWSDMQGGNNHLTYKGYFNGQEYVPSDGIGNGARQIRAVIWVVFYDTTTQA